MRRTMAITDLMHDAVDFALRVPMSGATSSSRRSSGRSRLIGQIQQVLHHVILNAQQAMPQGGVVEVRADNLSSEAALPPLLPPGAGSRLPFVIRAAASRRTSCRTSLIPMSPPKPVAVDSAHHCPYHYHQARRLHHGCLGGQSPGRPSPSASLRTPSRRHQPRQVPPWYVRRQFW